MHILEYRPDVAKHVTSFCTLANEVLIEYFHALLSMLLEICGKAEPMDHMRKKSVYCNKMNSSRSELCDMLHHTPIQQSRRSNEAYLLEQRFLENESYKQYAIQLAEDWLLPFLQYVGSLPLTAEQESIINSYDIMQLGCEKMTKNVNQTKSVSMSFDMIK